MKVYKFGGTSVGLPERMLKVKNILTATESPKVVVLSAVSGTTNDLVKLCKVYNDSLATGELLNAMRKKYRAFIRGLYQQEDRKDKMTEFAEGRLDLLEELVTKLPDSEAEILAQGEILSTQLFQALMEEDGVNSKLLDALDFMKLDAQGEPDMQHLEEQLNPQLEGAEIYLTQGFICRDHQGNISNLERGGSDYSASLIGAAIKADEVQIWTDIDGLHNNDPRHVRGTYPVSELSFDEAAELAYFGAKILHPSSILPAQKFNIPVRLKSTLNENAPGTLISTQSIDGTVKAIAVKDGITAIKIKSTRMLLAHGFLRRVFEVFEKYETAIDMITTSEVAVSLTIDDQSRLPEILTELKEFGFVDVDENQSIICVVGNMVSEQKGLVRRIFNALSDIPIRMVSYGGSRFNISMLIDTSYKFEALNNLNSGLFEEVESDLSS